jgi:hypothetical protein
MKSVFIIALVAVAMIGVMVPNVFAIASFVDQTKDPLHYIDRYFGEPEYKEWFDENYSQYSSIYEAVGLEESISIAYPSNWNVDLDFPPEIFIDTGIPKSKFGLLEYYPNGIIIQREDGVNQQLTDNDLMYNLQLHESKFCGSNWDFEYPVVSQECKNYGVSGKEYNLVSNHRSQTIFHENDMRLWEYIGYGPYFEYPTKGSVTNIQVGDTNWTVTITNEAEKFNQAFHYCVINSFKVGNLYENINQCEEDVSLKNLSFSPTNKNLKFKPEPDCGFFVGSVDGVCKWQESENPESVGMMTNLDEFIPEKFGIIEHSSNEITGRSVDGSMQDDVLVGIKVYSDENKIREHFEEVMSSEYEFPITPNTIAGATCIEFNPYADYLNYGMLCNKDNFEILVSAVDYDTMDSNMKQLLKKIDGPLSLPKISDSTGGGGCLIATATYGSEMAPQVQQLRELRDNQLLNTESGTAFMTTFNDVYYSFSPIIADYERENPYFKEAVKLAITPMISSLSLMENAESESEVISLGLSVIMLNIGMYLGVPAVLIVGIRKIK